MTYDEYTQAMQQMLVTTDVYGQAMFTSLLPRIIEYAELMMYRDPDFDFLATRTSDTTQSTQTGVRVVPIPSTFIVVENVNLITPANATLATPNYQRVSLLRATRPFVDTIWPQESATETPANFQTYWAIFSEQENIDEGAAELPSQIIIAPTPDNQYVTEFMGIFRPQPLSAMNTETYLTNYFPDLFLAASMIHAAGSVLKNYGAQADDPQQALSWKKLYDDLKPGAAIESYRQKGIVGGYGSLPPNSTMPNLQALQSMAAARGGR